MKVSKENFGWIFLSIALAIGLIVSVVLGFSGFYFRNSSSLSPDLKLGDYLQLDVRKDQANSLSVNVDGSYLPNEKLKQDLFVKNLEVDDEVYIRAKIYIFSSENNIINVKVNLAPNWKYNLQDGYYYYNSPLPPQNKATFASDLILDEKGQLYSNKKYIMTFLVESLSQKTQAENLWNVNYSTFFNEV